MMISPESYAEMQKPRCLSELIKEKNELIKEIEELEKIVFEKPRSSELWGYHPGPDVRYQCDLEYLAKLCEMISEKYRNRIWNEKTIIFSYSVSRFMSYGSDIALEVYEEDGKYYAKYSLPGENGIPKEEKIELDDEIIEKIKDIYLDNYRIMELEYEECPPVLDGCSQDFIFGDGKTENEINACNLWYYEKEKEEMSENTELLLSVFKKIRNILVEAGVDEACLKLE